MQSCKDYVFTKLIVRDGLMAENLDINKIAKALKSSWNRDTCYPSCLKIYDVSDKSTGQCAITSLIINDYLGGIIQSGYIEELGIKHYWNLINDEVIDITKGQFNKQYEFLDIKEKTREEMLSNENTKIRYELLRKRVSDFLDNNN